MTSSSNKKVGITALLLSLVGGLYLASPNFFKGRSEEARDFHSLSHQRMKRGAASRDGMPWNGGKPQPPIEIQSNLSGEIPADRDMDLVIDVVPGVECAELTSTVRGLDGVQLFGELSRRFTDCRAHEPHSHAVTVRAAAGVSGLVAVDLLLSGPSGSFQATKTVRIYADGAQILKKVGRLRKGAHGKAVVILDSGEADSKPRGGR